MAPLRPRNDNTRVSNGVEEVFELEDLKRARRQCFPYMHMKTFF